MEDEKIVEQFLARNEDAIKMTSDKYGKRLRMLSMGIVQDLSTAEECENDTYMEAWQSIPPHEPREYLYAFLARITRHISLNCCRMRDSLKRKAFICELTDELEQCIPSDSSVEERLDEIVLKDRLNSFIGGLSAEKRNIFLRRYWYLDSITTIAKRYGMSESKIKTMLYRIRKELYRVLEKEGYML